MSLKAFHVFFLVISIALCVGVGSWLYRRWQDTPQTSELVACALSFTAAAGLLVYFVWFLRKLKGVSYI